MIDVAAAARRGNNIRLDGVRARGRARTLMMLMDALAGNRRREHLRHGTENAQGRLLAMQSPARSLITLRLTLQRWWWKVGEVALGRDGGRVGRGLLRFVLFTSSFRLLPPLSLDGLVLDKLQI